MLFNKPVIFVLQFSVVVSDQSTPPQSASTNCMFTIQRDTCTPTFRGSYQASISECAPVGTSVTRVQAEDCDVREPLVYELRPNLVTDDLRAAYYFSVNPRTGDIVVRNNLLTASTTTSVYEVCLNFSFLEMESTVVK